jgi:hypothetical protein
VVGRRLRVLVARGSLAVGWGGPRLRRPSRQRPFPYSADCQLGRRPDSDLRHWQWDATSPYPPPRAPPPPATCCARHRGVQAQAARSPVRHSYKPPRRRARTGPRRTPECGRLGLSWFAVDAACKYQLARSVLANLRTFPGLRADRARRTRLSEASPGAQLRRCGRSARQESWRTSAARTLPWPSR